MQSEAGMLARAGVLAVLLVPGMPALATAQYESVPRPAAYALRNVTVVQADGRRQEGVTVVIRGALIEAMGRGVAVPDDAELVEGDSLMVYPGFVDGEGEAAHEFPQEEIDRDEVEIWNAPRSLQGFMPARRVVSHLTADGDDVADVRRAGIVAAAIHPSGAMMGGRGALVLYRKDAGMPQRLVIEPTLGPKFELRGGQGVYPGTLFGVMAFFRQAFEDARHGGAVAAAQERDPRGLTMPPYDPDYEVLRQVLAGDVPVYFAADEAADILRVLGLAAEYGFRPIIVGGAEAWKVADELLARDVPVLVSTNFPEPRRWDPDENEASELMDAATQREKLDLEDRYANAGRLAAAGVTVALTSGGTGKVLEGARKSVEHGLTEAAALAALTSTPAGLFGIPSMARLGEGLPATFIVTDGPLFDADTRITHTFVEGFVEDAATARRAGSAEDAVSFGGEWELTIETEEGRTVAARIQVEQDGATFTGTLEIMDDQAEVRDGVINGNEISAVAVLEEDEEIIEVEITGTVEGDEASGEAVGGPLGMSRWTARRTGPGGGR